MKRDATYNERTDGIILLAVRGTTCHVPRTSKETLSTQKTHYTFAKVIVKFKKLAYASRSGRPKTVADEGTSTQVLAAMARSPTKGTRCLSAEMRISHIGVMGNLQLTSGTHTSCRCCNI
ncbi:hypothetical protein AVEN_127142-1 [Araneus ventricosus]|uniref:Uncharacterized protein n=1 Tax=Araneus ventricosus TaxID=182803 RepID=A0A4Y2G877_ARAVE|nr:hypothetical protein AVEN_127142-1 [Araneus ventricosus]